MAYKNALAGLDLGGGKAVIIGDPRRDKTEALLRAYGRFVASLGGRYVTACDVGTYVADMDVVARECRCVTGRSAAHGGAGDSSVLTAYGVFQGMRAARRVPLGRTDAWRAAWSGSPGSARSAATWLAHLLEDGAAVVVDRRRPGGVERVRGEHPGVRGGRRPPTTCCSADARRLRAVRARRRAHRRRGRSLRRRSSAAPPTTSSPTPASPTLLAERGILYAPTTASTPAG